ncbi:MAG TPA: sugar ABC transporter permease [Thermotogota bacterium]|nr:sugar ABC transporter permease [Thermotogota bacterium]HPJ89407.1 sugar ABC transporter permease [Thermotogota bacterium]HPR96551.1 sugar ABC transporter permease [Thermotogota bacterium]
MTREKKRAMTGYLVMIPVLLVFAILIFYPAVRAFFDSFTDYSLFTPIPTFIGMDNYHTVLADIEFWQLFGRTLLLVFFSVALQYILGMSLALLLNEELRGMKWVKYIIMIPWVIPVVSTVVMFDWMMLPKYGLFNMILSAIGLGDLTRYWFGDPSFAFGIIIMMHVWRNMPFYAITLLAGLKSIPKGYYEAAQIDGANTVQCFFGITLPQLKYPSMIVIVLHVLWTFNNFDMIYLSTGGGPVGSTEVLSTRVYETAWTNYEYGKASAIGILMMILMLIFSLVYIRLVRSDEV